MCKMDPNDESLRIVLISRHAKKLLDRTIKECVTYKFPQDNVFGKGTFYVESFNNVIDIFKDKRILFGDDQYRCCVSSERECSQGVYISALAQQSERSEKCKWKENVQELDVYL